VGGLRVCVHNCLSTISIIKKEELP
jgi:hypothetical protein